MLDLGVDLDVWPWVWLFIAVTFALLEVTLLGGSFILLPFSVSGFAAAILGFYDAPIEAQWGVFLLGGGVLWVGFYRWAKRFLSDNVLPPGVGADRLVGMVGVVTVPVLPDDIERRGRVSVDGEVWGALSGTEVQLGEGTKVRIESIQGTRVVVDKIETEGPPKE